jgi:uroporphyrinogen-III decarboxylase
MKPRERLLKTFKGEKTDRMPVTLHTFDHARFVTKMYPELDPNDFCAINRKAVELSKQLGADVFVRMLYDAHDPISIFMGGLDVDQETDAWEVRTEEIMQDKTVIRRSTIRTPGGTLIQDYSLYVQEDGQIMQACTKKPIKTPKDLEIAMAYEPKMKPSFREKIKRKADILKNAVGEDGILGIWTPSGPFNQASLIYDLTELYTLYLTDYGFYSDLMTFAMERSLDYTEAMKAAGPDVLIVGGNVPGGFLGPRVYEDYILPFEKRFIDICQNTGIPAMYHNCGRIMALVESYKKLGVKSVEPFTPPPGGDADLGKAKEIIGSAYVTVGGVDKLELLLKGTVEQVKREIEKITLTAKKQGGHILQNADSLEYATPVENLYAYVQTAKEFGEY